MQPSPTAPPAGAARDAVFRRRFNRLDYGCLAPLRGDLSAFLHERGEERAYADMLGFTLTEILTNLIRHPEEKPRRVQVTVETTGRDIRLNVADDASPFPGFGEACESAPARLCAHDQMRESGYGLGCILQQHGQVEYVPLTRSGDGMNHFTVTDPRPPAPALRDTVFLVDDDPVTLGIHAAMLGNHYSVIPFGAARDALEAFDRITPDIIISDLTMPGMDGVALRKALMRRALGNETPFIFLSRHCESRDSTYINELGIDDFLCKPVTREHLLSVVARLLRRSRQIRSAVQEKMSADVSGMLRPSLPPKWGKWRLRVRSDIAEAGGGDFILHRESGGKMFFVLADVMGHGRMAKFFAYTYAGYLRSIFRAQEESCPAEFLRRLAACAGGDEFLESVIMTCQGVRLSPDGRAEIVSAGHPSPLVLRDDGCETFSVAGPLPGLTQDYPYAAKTAVLAPGERLCLATDGFLHAFGPDESRCAGLAATLARGAGKPLDDVVRDTWSAFAARMPARDDDATFIMLEYGG